MLDFLKTARELEEAGELLSLGERVGAGFESLVRQCKARGDEMFKSKLRTSKISKPPSILLGKNSWSAATRRSKLSLSLTSEIIHNELELARFQADAEAEEMERQAAMATDEAERQARCYGSRRDGKASCYR